MASSSLDLNALGAACWMCMLIFDGEGIATLEAPAGLRPAHDTRRRPLLRNQAQHSQRRKPDGADEDLVHGSFRTARPTC